ncbi:VOC family protein [Ferrovibrio terrae]|uniref:bleomycin resistance protein n=1 Tax=Ferrovibrio terrae TaxID=2594003 RepID=UPI003137DC43
MPAIAILPSVNLDRTAAFYRRLGFERQNRYPDYLVVVRDDFELHFADCSGAAPILLDPKNSVSACYFRCSDADILHREWQPLGLPRFSAIEGKPWGLREFHFVDPDGNLIRVGHPLA